MYFLIVGEMAENKWEVQFDVEPDIKIRYFLDNSISPMATKDYVQETEDRHPYLWRLPVSQVCQAKVGIHL